MLAQDSMSVHSMHQNERVRTAGVSDFTHYYADLAQPYHKSL